MGMQAMSPHGPAGASRKPVTTAKIAVTKGQGAALMRGFGALDRAGDFGDAVGGDGIGMAAPTLP